MFRASDWRDKMESCGITLNRKVLRSINLFEVYKFKKKRSNKILLLDEIKDGRDGDAEKKVFETSYNRSLQFRNSRYNLVFLNCEAIGLSIDDIIGFYYVAGFQLKNVDSLIKQCSRVSSE